MTDFERQAALDYDRFRPDSFCYWDSLAPSEKAAHLRMYKAAFSAGSESMRERAADRADCEPEPSSTDSPLPPRETEVAIGSVRATKSCIAQGIRALPLLEEP